MMFLFQRRHIRHWFFHTLLRSMFLSLEMNGETRQSQTRERQMKAVLDEGGKANPKARNMAEMAVW